MHSRLIKIKTLLRLGLPNLLRVGAYRAGLRLQRHPVLKINSLPCAGPFFVLPSKLNPRFSNLRPNPYWDDAGIWFGKHVFEICESPPEWLRSPFTRRNFPESNQPWWKLADFTKEAGDIKEIWELSRFDWLLAFAQRVVLTEGEKRDSAVDRLNVWLSDWTRNNPCYNGPNWKCGQEAAIRVLHLILAAHFLNQLDSPTASLQNLVENHLRRIAPTVSYAVAQCNNHANSEAAALFIGGDWLERNGRSVGEDWSQLGRYWLDDRAQKLIDDHGTFSQYSVNYHRLMLDAYSLSLWWQKKYVLPPFEKTTIHRLEQATDWLGQLVDQSSGDAPNLGANDGANLLPLTPSDYRDYRPCLNLAQVLVRGHQGLSDSYSRDHLGWLELDDSPPLPSSQPPNCLPLLKSSVCPPVNVLKQSPWRVIVRNPVFRFRPGQSDALHVDLWFHDINLLRDAGSFSYFTEDGAEQYFGGTAAHNTVQFDGRNQMPRLGRFLWGEWLKHDHYQPPGESDGKYQFGCGYRDWRGARHLRTILLDKHKLIIKDQVSGFVEKAVLRWRVIPGGWELKPGDHSVRFYNNKFEIQVECDQPIVRAQCQIGWESRYYRQRSELPVLEIEVSQAATLQTQVQQRN